MAATAPPPPPLSLPDSVCTLCRPKAQHFSQKKNPLKNLNIMLRLNPYVKTQRRHALLEAMRNKAAKEKAAEAKSKKAATQKTKKGSK